MILAILWLIMPNTCCLIILTIFISFYRQQPSQLQHHTACQIAPKVMYYRLDQLVFALWMGLFVIIDIMFGKLLSQSTSLPRHSTKLLKTSKKMTVEFRYSYSGELPKGSQFSNFMGLQKQLQTVRKEQIKQQKSDVVTNSIMIIGSVVLLGGFIFIALYDQNTRFLLSLEYTKLRLNLLNSAKHQRVIVKQGLTAINQFLKATPYQYAMVLDYLSYFGKQLRRNREQQLIQICHDCYTIIVRRNFKSPQNVKLVQGVSNLLQLMFLTQQTVSDQLVKALMKKGEIQQAYLGLVYAQKILRGKIGLQDQEFKAEVKENLRSKNTKDTQYYKQVFSNRQEEDYPQIAFKRRQEQKWLKHIQTSLNISVQ